MVCHSAWHYRWSERTNTRESDKIGADREGERQETDDSHLECLVLHPKPHRPQVWSRHSLEVRQQEINIKSRTQKQNQIWSVICDGLLHLKTASAIFNLCFQDAFQRCISPDGYAVQSPRRSVPGSHRPPAGSECGCYRGRTVGPGPWCLSNNGLGNIPADKEEEERKEGRRRLYAVQVMNLATRKRQATRCQCVYRTSECTKASLLWIIPHVATPIATIWPWLLRAWSLTACPTCFITPACVPPVMIHAPVYNTLHVPIQWTIQYVHIFQHICMWTYFWFFSISKIFLEIIQTESGVFTSQRWADCRGRIHKYSENTLRKLLTSTKGF